MFSLVALVVASLAVFVNAEDQHHWHPRPRPCHDSSWSSYSSSSSSCSSSSSSSSSCHRKPCCGCPKEKGLKWAKEASQEYLDLLTEGLPDAAAIFQTPNFESPPTIIQCTSSDKCTISPGFGNILDVFGTTIPFEFGTITDASYQHDGSIVVTVPYYFYVDDFNSVSLNVLLRWVWTEDCLLKVNLGVLFDVRCQMGVKMINAYPTDFCPTPTPTYFPPYSTTTSTITYTQPTQTITSTSTASTTQTATDTSITTSTTTSTITSTSTTTSTSFTTSTIFTTPA